MLHLCALYIHLLMVCASLRHSLRESGASFFLLTAAFLEQGLARSSRPVRIGLLCHRTLTLMTVSFLGFIS